MAAIIAGDWHNYNRYYAHELDVHFITSGGGGAFLHPTHVLKNNISVRWPERADEARAGQAGAAGGHPGEAWQAREYDIRLKRNTQAAGSAVEQAVQDVQDALEPLQPTKLRRRRLPLRPQAPKCYPSKARSYLLSLRNVLFPFYNPAFAIGIGILYWLITWEFQTVATRFGISGTKIDDLGVGTSSLLSVLRLMPLYLVQAMIVSIALTIMLGALYATLVWYVDATERPGFRRYATKFLVGTAHFLAHMTAMFALSLVVVSVNNQLAPVIQKQMDALYATREQQPQIVRDVIEEFAGAAEAQDRGGGRQEPIAGASAGRLHLLSHSDGLARRPGRRLAVGPLLGADRPPRPHACRGRVRGLAHCELQEFPQVEVRAATS